MPSLLGMALILTVHFFADFVCQTDYMALNKSKSLKALGLHASVYTLVLLLPFGWLYALLNGLIHFVVDGTSSRITAKLWAQKKRYAFFVVIGFDQLVHTLTLLATYSFVLWAQG